LIPEPYSKDITFLQERVRGYYGNPIIKAGVVIEDKPVAQAFTEALASSLEPADKAVLESDIEHYIDNSGKLYLRLDKQAACRGSVKLRSSDPIRVVIKLSSWIRDIDKAVDQYRRIGFLDKG